MFSGLADFWCVWWVKPRTLYNAKQAIRCFEKLSFENCFACDLKRNRWFSSLTINRKRLDNFYYYLCGSRGDSFCGNMREYFTFTRSCARTVSVVAVSPHLLSILQRQSGSIRIQKTSFVLEIHAF